MSYLQYYKSCFESFFSDRNIMAPIFYRKQVEKENWELHSDDEKDNNTQNWIHCESI